MNPEDQKQVPDEFVCMNGIGGIKLD